MYETKLGLKWPINLKLEFLQKNKQNTLSLHLVYFTVETFNKLLLLNYGV